MAGKTTGRLIFKRRTISRERLPGTWTDTEKYSIGAIYPTRIRNMPRELIFQNEVHTDCYCDRVGLLVTYGPNTIFEVVRVENIKTGVFWSVTPSP